VQELAGWARLLIEEHVPFDVVVAERVTDPSELSRYRLVILPGLTRLSDEFCRVVSGYVESAPSDCDCDTPLEREDERRKDFGLPRCLASVGGTSRRHFAVTIPDDAEPATGPGSRWKPAASRWRT